MENIISLKFCGFACKGSAKLNLWGGGSGTMMMSPWNVNSNDCNSLFSNSILNTIMDGINDGGFGCESIASAEIDVYGIYKNADGAYCEVYLDTLIWERTAGILNIPK